MHSMVRVTLVIVSLHSNRTVTKTEIIGKVGLGRKVNCILDNFLGYLLDIQGNQAIPN